MNRTMSKVLFILEEGRGISQKMTNGDIIFKLYSWII